MDAGYTQPTHATELSAPRARIFDVAAANAALLGALAFWILLLVFAMPQELVQDSWLTLLSGREVVQHGLPHADHLTIWTDGRAWIDQQWLAQSFFYAVFVAGGVRLVLLVHVVLFGVTSVASLAFIRPIAQM